VAHFTVVGASGFIGTELCLHLKANGHSVEKVGRNIDLSGRQLGNLIYAAGVTADFRTRTFETVQAHVCHLSYLLQVTRFNSFLYLSSARVYSRSTIGVEAAELKFRPEDPEDIFNLSKTLGESICLANPREEIRVARLSNVIGEMNTSPSFFSILLEDAVKHGRLKINTSPDSAKDYISLKDVVSNLTLISLSGREKIYNVASGQVISHAEIANLFIAAGISVEFANNAPKIVFPEISIQKIKNEFAFNPQPVLPLMKKSIDKIQIQKTKIFSKV
jgi:nucleoside-diphosphate-sugar epimerase